MSKPVVKVQNLKRYFKQYKKEAGLKGTLKSLFKREHFDIKRLLMILVLLLKKEGRIYRTNSAGKTTTLKMLSGILYPSDGIIEVLGYKPFKERKSFLKDWTWYRPEIALVGSSRLWKGFVLNKEIYEMNDKAFKTQVEYLSEMLDAKDILDIQLENFLWSENEV
ncbi:MAG: hypothetical protein Q9M91_08810 [Candidatus Dojkabacteria bacterium]|nr:hypothetical protein [Candidatus Dojkabacteria bacterium]